MELMVSVIIFLLIMGVLYEVLNISHKSSERLENVVDRELKIKQLKQIFLEDFIYATNSVSIEKSDDKVIIRLKSDNTLHNSFYRHITYMVSKEKNLLRIESLTQFNSQEMNDEFFEKAYIDRVISDVGKFEMVPLNDTTKRFSIMIKVGDKTEIFSLLQG